MVKDLHERLRSAVETGALMAPAVLGLIRDLAGILASNLHDLTAHDVEAIGLLIRVHWIRYQLLPQGQDQDDLRGCLAWSIKLLPIAPDMVPSPIRARLTTAGGSRTGATGDAAAAATAGARAAYQEYEQTGNIEYLQKALTLFRQGVAVAPGDHPDRPAMLSNLGVALRGRFGRLGQLADLDEAITIGREAVAAALADHPHRPVYLSSLGGTLQVRFGRLGQLADLDEAITIGRQAVAAALADHPDRPAMLSSLGGTLQVRFGRLGQLADVDEAITLFRQAVAAAPVDDPHRPVYLSSLGNALCVRFEQIGQLADVDEAITLFRQAVTATPAHHVNRLAMLSNLGNALCVRFGRLGQLADLDEAITLFRQAVAAAPGDHPDRPAMLSNLGDALRVRFGRLGQLADLDEAIIIGRDAVTIAPAHHVNRPAILSSLGSILRVRFGRAGQLADLDEAITLFRQAVAAAPVDHPQRPGYLSSLGVALQVRFGRAGQLADLDEAITIGREAVTATSADHPHRPGYLSSLGVALQVRFEQIGQLADVDEAITIGRDSVTITSSNHPGRPTLLSNLGTALRRRFERAGQLADLDEAVTLFRQAVAAAPVDHPDRPAMLSNLGNAMQVRFERAGQPADLDEAITAGREGAGVATASPRWRLEAARRWGRCALLARDPGTAVEGYEAAIGLLPLVVWHGLDQVTREHHLRVLGGLACEAATAAVDAGDPVKAVELVEAGRAMLWTQALHLRHDLAALHQGHPELAAALEHARTVLNSTSNPPAGDWVGGLSVTAAGDLDQAWAAEQLRLAERRQAAREWDAAVEQVRQVEGFADFLRPVPFVDLRPAAADGPVVIVNVSRYGSHALIVVPETRPRPGPHPALGVQVVDLPAVSWETVIDQANALLAIQDRTARYQAGDPTVDDETRESDRHAVFDILAWTWQAITEPVLTALGHTTIPLEPIEQWPRMWWCPTGPAAILPLHAAGRHPRTGIQYAGMGEAAAIADTVVGRVVSSYTPTLTALIRSRTRPVSARVRALIAGVPDAPRQRPLPGVLPELEAVAAALPPSTATTYLISPTVPAPTFTVQSQSTRGAVLEALPQHSWLHLSCHGSQDQDDVSRSAFWLRDAPLTLADLAALDLPDADLAYLGVCQTATGGFELLDESLHLAGALQMVGYRHVLATLWTISDAAAPLMAQAIYTHLTHPDLNHPQPADQPDSARAAHALHHATARLRQLCPSEPLLWTPYIHLGP